MGRTRRSVVFALYLFFGYIMSAVPIVGEIHGCKEEHRDCIRCDSSHHCTKCTRLIVVGTRQCVDRCPSGYREEWSSFVSYMGRICRETGFLGLPGRTLAIVVGAFSGAAICMGILLGGYLYLRHRKHCETKAGILRSTRDQDRRLECEMEERYEFLKHLAALRCEAPVFLAMLNDTRRQVRELHQNTGHSDTAVQAYLPVLKDLARILTLLNQPDHTIYRPPPDWEKLLAWSERVLRRYKKQNHYQVQELPLVSFLPVPIQTNQRSSPSVSISPEPNLRALTTFQPIQATPKTSTGINHHSTSSVASHNLQDMAISAFDNNYNNSITSHDAVLRLQNTSLIDSDFNACWEFNPANYTILAEWSASQDYLVDDDFFTLGFRPQDEITTEL